MEAINFSYEHTPKLWEFASDDSRIRGIRGPVGSGKSSACVMEIPRRALMQNTAPDGMKYSRFVVVRNSYRELRDTTMKTFFEWFPEKYFGTFRVTDNEYTIDKIQGCHIEVLFRALDKAEDIKKLLSLDITGAWINEAREVPKVIWDGLDMRLGRYPSVRNGGCAWKGIWMDTNPPDEDSDWYKFFEIDQPDNARQFVQPSGVALNAENIPNLPENYYHDISKGKDRDFISVYVENKYGFVREGDPVYGTNWNDSLHVSTEHLRPIKGKEILVGLDFGLTPSAVFTQLTPKGKFLVLDEIVSDSMGIERFGNNLLKPLINTKYKDYTLKFIGDPAGNQRVQTNEKTCYEELRALGIRAEPARYNDDASRQGAVEKFLTTMVDGSPSLLLDPACKILRKGFNGGYVKDASGKPKKHSIYSHPHDALQYAALELTMEIRRNKRPTTVPRRYQVPTSAGY
jgi:PBSX family phage terminase large subunit